MTYKGSKRRLKPQRSKHGCKASLKCNWAVFTLSQRLVETERRYCTIINMAFQSVLHFFSISLFHSPLFKTSKDVHVHLECVLLVRGWCCHVSSRWEPAGSCTIVSEVSETAEQVALIFLSHHSNLYKSGYMQTDTTVTQRSICKSDSLNIMTFFIINYYRVLFL